MYGGERADARALDHLEVVVRELADELASWRARALKAEGDLKGGGRGRGDDAEARALRQRLDAARTRIADLVARLGFLEEQTRAADGAGSGR